MTAMAGATSTARQTLASRPFVEVALYWHNPTWSPFVTDTARLQTLRPEDGQRARLYLGIGHEPPLFDYWAILGVPHLRTITIEGRRILESHGVHVQLDPPAREP